MNKVFRRWILFSKSCAAYEFEKDILEKNLHIYPQDHFWLLWASLEILSLINNSNIFTDRCKRKILTETKVQPFKGVVKVYPYLVMCFRISKLSACREIKMNCSCGVCRNFINIPDYLFTRIDLEIAFRLGLTNVTKKPNYNIALQSIFNQKAVHE